MIEKECLELTSNNGLLIGKQGEFLTNHYDFYSVFETPIEYSVRNDSYEVGTLNNPMPPKTTFVLAGKTWKVLELDEEKKIIYVVFAKGKPPTSWESNPDSVEHTKVLKKMREIIFSDIKYSYLDQNAEIRLREIRNVIKKSKIYGNEIFEISPNTYGIFPWLGSKALGTLSFALCKKLGNSTVEIQDWPVMIIKNVKHNDLINALILIKFQNLTYDDLILPDEIAPIGKYGNFIPKELLYKEFKDKYIGIDEMQKELDLSIFT
jgi:ATP-dependent helicase Lhr and Lhr-like helicase